MKSLALLSFLLLISAPASAFANDFSGCIVCHNSMAGRIIYNGKEIALKVDADRYQASTHGFFSCTECHERFGENPHAAPAEVISSDIEKLSKRIKQKADTDAVALAACYKCHTETYNQVLGSIHGKNIADKKLSDGALCLDCHGSPHYITPASDRSSPVNQWNVVETCGKCHGKEGLAKKYGIEVNVMKSYTESFHGKKHILGHKKAPTCVNCHGYHNIKSTDNPSSPVFGINKIQTCGKCHKGANEKFVAAITHKEAGPIPHYAEKGLILLTMSVIAFTVLHVLLEAFSDIRDTFFRRRKEEDEDEESEQHIP
ncbi:MAG: hypothetical protein GXO95_04955 [Nitrospirae bacterium]|nr:hypothetical protein [Nitrospirota bacterium]